MIEEKKKKEKKERGRWAKGGDENSVYNDDMTTMTRIEEP